MDRFAALTAFVAVADRRGFAPAARHLGLSPSLVTRQVAALEERIGARLLARTTRSVALTEAGGRFVERARRILAELAEAEAAALSDQTEPVGRLAVTAPAVFGRLHVAPLMGEVLRRHPRIQGHLVLSDRWINLIEDGMDLAVRIGRLPDSGLVARRLGAARRVVVASPDYLARHGEPVAPAEVQRHQIIAFSGFERQGEWRFAGSGGEIRVPIVPRLLTNSADAALDIAERHGGLTTVLSYQADAALRAGRLRVVLAPFELPPLPIQIVHAGPVPLPARLRAFIDLAAETCRWEFV